MSIAAPVISDVTHAELVTDPYPFFRRVREAASAVFVPPTNLILVTRFDDILQIERDPDTYSSVNPASLVHNIMGPTFMRKDGEEHACGRRALDPSFKARTIKDFWAPKFDATCARLLETIKAQGEADLFAALAAPMASTCLSELIGFQDVGWETLAEWSQALIDGVGNYAGDPEVEHRARAAGEGVDSAIDRVLDHHRGSQNPTILSSMAHADPPMPLADIRGNIKVIIGGGLNEPRDAILTLALGLLQNPEQMARVVSGADLWGAAFDEAVRWTSPIGIYPRRVARETKLSGVILPEGAQVGVCVGAANRDERRFEHPDVFDVFRRKQSHLAFGSGPHFCAGSWVSRQMVAKSVAPMLFDRLRNLRLRDDAPPVVRGWVFRGPVSLPVRWDA